MAPMYALILAGGGGTRLWPLSAADRPKPFLPLLGPESLFERTVRRLLEGDELGLRPADVTVVTDARYVHFVRAQAPGVAVLAEPVGRNTAAAIALATVAIDRPADEVMVVLSADQTIEREGVFRDVLAAAARLAEGAFGIAAPLVTLGIEVDRPATEYGYLLPRIDRGGIEHGLAAYPLERFEEKPTPARALELLAEPGVAWNAGMFLWRRSAIRTALEASAPEILATVAAGHAGGPDALAAAYPGIRSISIDYAVLEPAAAAGRVVMGAMDVGWSDLGSWSALLAALGCAPAADGRVVGAGETADAGPDDLIVRRAAGPAGTPGALVLEAGPRSGILDPSGPAALLTGTGRDRATVEALLARCSHQETSP
jgi:mannose-1-phosphate guanylyltransferase